MLGFLAIILVTVCGLAGAPLWSVALAAVGLASISYARHLRLYERAADLSLQDEIDRTLIASLANCFVASAAAYGCGAALRFLSLG